jgi:hypothetical protein
MMGRVILDPELRAKLNGLNEQMEISDETGKPVGLYLPLDAYKKLLYADVKIPFSEEEIARLRGEKEGRSLAEIWKSLGQK